MRMYDGFKCGIRSASIAVIISVVGGKGSALAKCTTSHLREMTSYLYSRGGSTADTGSSSSTASGVCQRERVEGHSAVCAHGERCVAWPR